MARAADRFKNSIPWASASFSRCFTQLGYSLPSEQVYRIALAPPSTTCPTCGDSYCRPNRFIVVGGVGRCIKWCL